MDERQKTSSTKDAIIFIPGLGRHAVDQRLETIAEKLAEAMDRQDPRPEQKFRVIGMPDEEYGNSFRAQVRAIGASELNETETRSVADLYELDYLANLTQRFEARNPVSKVLVMVGVLIPVALRSIWSIRQKGKHLKDKLQMLTMALVMMCVAVFIGIILVAGVQTLKEIGTYGPIALFKTTKEKGETLRIEAGEKQTTSEDDLSVVSFEKENASTEFVQTDNANGEKETPDEQDGMNPNDIDVESSGPKLGILQALVVIFSALGLFSRGSLKGIISAVATEYVCASNYLRIANQKQLILGQVMALLEHIAEKREKYDNVHIVAYSFGTLLAIDSLFPHTRPSPRLTMVKRLITIGCPFDIVRIYWPNYFTHRSCINGTPSRWINLYAPLDVFGSNFRNDPNRLDAEQGVTLKDKESEPITPDKNIDYDAGFQADQLNWFDVLTVKGMKFHGGYWTAEKVPELSCFDSIITELFNNEIK